MRVFLCSFKGFSIAIPMDSIASVALHAGESSEYAVENEKEAISFPQLFSLPEEIIRHILIMKKPHDETIDAEESNLILMTTEIECEIEIPDDQIFPLPRVLWPTRFSALFTGIQFNSGKLLNSADYPILFLNCKELNRFTQKEKVL